MGREPDRRSARKSRGTQNFFVGAVCGRRSAGKLRGTPNFLVGAVCGCKKVVGLTASGDDGGDK